MHHLMAYTVATGGAATLLDTPAAADTVFTVQNNHFIFTDQLQLIAAAGMGATLTQAQIYSPSLIPYGLLNLWPLNPAVLPSSFPRIADFRDAPYKLPTNEQIQFLGTNTAAETQTGHLWVTQPGWSRNKTRGIFHSTLVLTGSITRVANSWSGPAALTFQNIPQGGWYAVNGVYLVAANSRAFRVYFPRSPTVSGRQFRPGSLCTTTVGNMEYGTFNRDLGTWGAFHTFEPLTFELFADAAGAQTVTAYVDVQYLGQGDAGSYPSLAA